MHHRPVESQTLTIQTPKLVAAFAHPTPGAHRLVLLSAVAALMLVLSAPSGLALQALPPVPEPAENPITEGKRVLGKILFWDEQLSSDNTVARLQAAPIHASHGTRATTDSSRHPTTSTARPASSVRTPTTRTCLTALSTSRSR